MKKLGKLFQVIGIVALAAGLIAAYDIGYCHFGPTDVQSLTVGLPQSNAQQTGIIPGVMYPYGGSRQLLVEDYITTTTANTIIDSEMCGKLFTMTSTSDDPVTHNLPAAVVGEWAYFTDMDATAAADLILNPVDADQINGGTAGVSWNATGDASVPESCLIYCRVAGQWVLIPMSGTWGAGS